MGLSFNPRPPPGIQRILRVSSRCRFCETELLHSFVDLGTSPLCQSQVEPADRGRPEPFYPLHVWVCHACFLVQLEEIVAPGEIFGTGEYAYFSSYSDSWLDHARRYAEAMTARLGLDGDSLVVEVASNDGYLLQYFHEKGIPVLGIEPAENCAAVAREKGIESVAAFFGRCVCRRFRSSACALVRIHRLHHFRFVLIHLFLRVQHLVAASAAAALNHDVVIASAASYRENEGEHGYQSE